MASFDVVFDNMHLADRPFDIPSARIDSAEGVWRAARTTASAFLTLDEGREAIHYLWLSTGSSSALCRDWIAELFPVDTGFAYPLDIVIYSK